MEESNYRMISFLRNLFAPRVSSFIVVEIDYLRKVVVLEDQQLNLRIEIPIGDKPLKEVKVIEPYVILLTYEDGSQKKKKILT